MATIINASTSAGLVESADTSGILQLQSGGVTQQTIDSTGSHGQLILGTVKDLSTGAAFYNFTGIPSWVKRVTVNITNVSTSGNANLRFRIGPVAGVETSGYLGTTVGFAATSSASIQFTLGFDVNDGGNAAAARNGSFFISLLDPATNTWAIQGSQGQSNTNNATFIGGSKPLAGALSVLQITTVNGTDTFDSGSANIIYEG